MAKINISATIEETVIAKAKAKAKAANRPLSNYIETALIKANGGNKKKAKRANVCTQKIGDNPYKNKNYKAQPIQ